MLGCTHDYGAGSAHRNLVEVCGVFDEFPATLHTSHVRMKGVGPFIVDAFAALARIDPDVVNYDAADADSLLIFELDQAVDGRPVETRKVPAR